MIHPAFRSQRGFTLTELMVTVAIIGILAAFAFPSMSRLMVTQKVRSTSYDLNADLTYARSEAIARGHTVTIQSADGSTNWASGWQVWDTTAAPTVKLREESPTSAGVAFTADQVSLSFDRTGRTSGPAVSFNIVPTDASATTDQKRCVKIDPSGRPHTTTGACP